MAPDSLGLFGVLHFDRMGKVTDELRTFVDADAIFIEYPRDPIGPRTAGSLLLRVPAYFLGGMLLQLLFYAPLFLVFARDLYPTEAVAVGRVADERDLPVHRVDEHPNIQLLDAGPRTVAANWGVVAAVAYLGNPAAVGATATLALFGGLVPLLVRRRGHRLPALGFAVLALVAVEVTFQAGLLSFWLLTVGALSFLAVVFTTIDDRNDVMLDRIERLSGENGYADGVLITGKGHLAGLVRLADERGLDVPKVHVSSWLRAGRTYADVDEAALPEVGVSSGRDGPVEGIVPDSERSVLGKRIGAAVIDLLLASVLAIVAMLGVVLLADIAGFDGTVITALLSLLLAALAWFGYYVLQESRRNRTWGKARFGLAVARADGGPPKLSDAVVRNLLRPVDMYLFGVGVFLLLIDRRRRRLGDRAGGTVVGNAVIRDEGAARPSGTDP